MKKLIFWAILNLFLASTLVITIDVHPAIASGIIYIRSDGSIDPQTAPINRNGDVYTLTGNITTNTDGIIIERDNAEIDGAGYTLQGIGIGTGITLSNRNNITIKHVKICNFTSGVALLNSSGNILSGNDVRANAGKNIHLLSSSFNILSYNNVADSDQGITLELGSHNNVLSCNNVTDCNQAITLWFSSYCNLSGNTITRNQCGMIFTDSSGEKVFHNNFVNNTIQVEVNLWCSPHILWHDSFPSGGNYWSDYVDKYPNATEIDASGIWNTPYVISKGNIDNYPLISPWSPPDIAVMTITSSKTVVGQGLAASINITLSNQGNKAEGFDVFLYANDSLVAFKYVILTSGNLTLVTFAWETADFGYGNYTLWVYAKPILGEVNIEDNVFAFGIVTVTIVGDVDGDFDVDIIDVTEITSMYYSRFGNPDFNPNCDIDEDGMIKIFDVVKCTSHYGQKYPFIILTHKTY